MYREAVLFLLAGAASFGELVESPAWVEFAVNCTGPNRSESVLSDFSYAGYRFSNAQIPDVSDCQRLSVADYGVLPDDQSFDDEGIQAAIDAAVAADEPTVVFFPAGRYMVGDEAHARTPIVVNGSHVVLLGSGAGEGRTEIYADWSGGENESGVPSNGGIWRFQFRPDARDSELITTIASDVRRGDFAVNVADASALSVGQSVDVYHRSVDTLELNMPSLELNEEWRIANNSIWPYEKHVIDRIQGNRGSELPDGWRFGLRFVGNCVTDIGNEKLNLER